MKDLTAVCGAAIVALLLAGCNQSGPDTHEADVKALKDNETQWNQDFAAKDPDKLASYYADNAVLMTPGTPPSAGKDAIRNALRQLVSDPALSVKFQASRIDVAKSGDLAYTQGSYTMRMTDPRTKKVVDDHGSYVATFRRNSDGSWKAVADIATSEVPPAMSPSPSPKGK